MDPSHLISAKIATIWPEVVMLLGAVACLATGLWNRAAVRRATVWVAAGTLVIAGVLAAVTPGDNVNGLAMPAFAKFIKLAVVGVGLLLLLLAAGVPEGLRAVRRAESANHFEPGDTVRGEFFAFFLFSLAGVMLTAGADDLVWLFLALELTSLPTYVMVATGRDRRVAQESAVKYFFLGAMSAAVFLYGFALIYGATGTTSLSAMRLLADGGLAPAVAASPMLMIGLVLAIVGICFKIAAFPMHFYAADVYQGADTAVTAFLAFVPKTAGIAAILLLLGTVGWTPLPVGIMAALWVIAAVTMTLGNVLALLQTNVKRTLAYSSVAHSGYLLVGVIAGTSALGEGVGGAVGGWANGVAAVLFYLVAYALGTIGSFAVLSLLEAQGEEAQTYDDLSGLRERHPTLAVIMAISVLSLLGFPFTAGLLGKVYLVGSSLSEGGFWMATLVVILVLNSAVSAAYYLRIASVCFFGESKHAVSRRESPARFAAAALAASLAVILGLFGGFLIQWAGDTATPRVGPIPVDRVEQPIPALTASHQNPLP